MLYFRISKYDALKAVIKADEIENQKLVYNMMKAIRRAARREIKHNLYQNYYVIGEHEKKYFEKLNKKLCKKHLHIPAFRDIIQETYGEISKWGRLRPPPVADEGSKKEWQRSKFCEANSERKISGTATGHNGAPRSMKN